MSEEIRSKKRVVGRPFQKGNQAAVGHKGGPGRPPSEFIRRCEEALDKVGQVDFAAGLIKGAKLDGPFGKVAARPETRLEALKWLVERVHGKVKQELEHSGKLTLESLVTGSNEEESE